MTSIDDVRDREPRARARRGGSPAAARGAVEPRAPRRTGFAAAADSGSRPCVDRSRPRRGSRATQRDRATPCTTSKRTWSATWPGAPSSTTSPESRLRRRGRHVGPVIAGVPPHRRGVADRSFPRGPCRSTRVPGRPSSASLHHAVPDALLSIRSAIVRPAPTVSPWLRQSRPDNSMTPTASTTGESCGRLPSPSSARVTSPRA